jgi:hypothetical protein
MKTLRLLVVVCVVLMISTAAWGANPPLPKAEGPAFTTSFGQSQDSNFVSILSRRIKLENVHKNLGNPDGPDWDNAKTVIAVIGGSGKGLGAAGLGVPVEIKRCDSIIAAAKAQKKYIIGMHIGGEDRRGPNSQDFVPYAGSVDFMIVRADGNKDDYFTKLCNEKGIPLYIIENTKEVEGVLKQIFGL